MFSVSIFSQADWEKWEKTEISYEIKSGNPEKGYSFSSETVPEFAARSLTNFYQFFISDADGDNCPFHPSCSNFMVESVRETNIFQGALMFADRFTRDINFVNRESHYPRTIGGRFYDPPKNYSLKNVKVKFIPPSDFIKN
jgi:putative component of membrane protein insertase Oxa1/YidC/SpoIIIJ protein YidD